MAPRSATHRADTPRTDLHRTLTTAVIAAIAAIERGETTSTMPWTGGGPLPRQLGSDTPYRGVNVLHLRAVASLRGYRSPSWGGFRAWRARGGHVRRGERGTVVVYSRTTDTPEASTGEPGTGRAVRTFTVFNRDQVDGLSDDPVPCASVAPPLGEDDRAAVARIDAFAEGLGAHVRRSGPRAFYHRRTDSLTVPPIEWFASTRAGAPGAGYASTLAHELVHWSGSRERVARPIEPGRLGHAREELVAELGAACLAPPLGFAYRGVADHAGYMTEWLELLRGDDRALVRALRDASAAAAWLLDREHGVCLMREHGRAALADA